VEHDFKIIKMNRRKEVGLSIARWVRKLSLEVEAYKHRSHLEPVRRLAS